MLPYSLVAGPILHEQSFLSRVWDNPKPVESPQSPAGCLLALGDSICVLRKGISLQTPDCSPQEWNGDIHTEVGGQLSLSLVGREHGA